MKLKYNHRDHKHNYNDTAVNDVQYGWQCENCGRAKYQKISWYKAPKFTQVNYKCPHCGHEKDMWYNRGIVEQYLNAD